MSAPTQLSSQILEQAARWFVEFRTDEVPPAVRLEFYRWLRASPQHIGAYLELARTYADLASAKAQLGPQVTEMLARPPGPAYLFRLRPNVSLAPKGQRHRHGRPNLAVATLAVILAVTGVLAALAWHDRGIYATGIGEQRSITLSDGSTIDLDANSRIQVRFSRTGREIDLVQGHALFADIDDPHRPFIVLSRGIVIRALGTQFDVNRQITGTVVAVIQGKVVLSDHVPSLRAGTNSLAASRARVPAAVAASISSSQWGEDTRGRFVFLSSGEQATIRSGTLPAIGSADIVETVAWRRHQLVFDDTPVIDVVNEFNRYSSRPIEIESPVLGRLRIDGIYNSTDPASFLRFLRAQGGIVVDQAGGQTHIRQSTQR